VGKVNTEPNRENKKRQKEAYEKRQKEEILERRDTGHSGRQVSSFCRFFRLLFLLGS
jgi:hypothetical protein